MVDVGFDFEKVVGTAVVTATVTFLSVQLRHASEGSRRKKNIAKALYVEIQENTKELDKFLEQDPEAVKAAVMADRSLIPHLVYNDKTYFFEQAKDHISSFPTDVLEPVVVFYNELEYLYAQIDGLEKPTFKCISDNGRAQAIQNMWDSVARASRYGEKAMESLKLHLPPVWWRD